MTAGLNMPTIEVMYANASAWDGGVFKTVAINSGNDQVEIAPFNELECTLDRQHIIDKFERAINKAEGDLNELRAKRDYFVKRFATAFESVATQS